MVFFFVQRQRNFTLTTVDFISSAVEFLPSLERRTWELVSCILRRKDGQGLVNLPQCFSHYAYDFMVSFSRRPSAVHPEFYPRESLCMAVRTTWYVVSLVIRVCSLHKNSQELMRDGDVFNLVGGAKSGLAMFDR
jgi:hypothetical protein